MRSLLLLQAFVAVVKAQSATPTSTGIPADAVATPDALDIEAIRDIPEPTYTIVDGLMSQDIEYAISTALESVVADITESPLSVFPAVTGVPINAAGLDSSTTDIPEAMTKRADHSSLERRAACAAQATIPNYYGVDVSSYASFKSDSKIASVANAASTPQGYFQSFKNAPGASSACKLYDRIEVS